MKKSVLLNGLLNLVLAAIFVAVNNWALQNQFEKTFVSVAVVYGCTVTIGNSLFTSFIKAA